MSETIWIAIGIIAIIILIIGLVTVYSINISRKQKELLLGSLNEALRSRHLNADRSEYFRNRVIALDGRAEALIYVTTNEDGSRSEIIDLAEVRHCNVMNIGNKTVTTGKSGKKTTEEHINEIHLELSGPTMEPASIMFYSEIQDGLSELLDNRKKAETWKQLINSMIKNGA